MAAVNATAFPVNGQAYRLYFKIVSSLTGNPITGGLTGLGANISKDGAAFVNIATLPPTEILTGGVGSGYGYVELTGTEMTCTAAVIKVVCGNTNAVEWSAVLLTTGVPQVQSGLATSSAMATGFASVLSAISALASATFNWAASAAEQVGVPTTYIGYAMRAFQIIGNAWVRSGASQTSFLADSVTPGCTSVVQDGQTSANRSRYQ